MVSSSMRANGQIIKLQSIDGEDTLNLSLDLMGEYQCKNILAVVCAVDYLNRGDFAIEISEGEMRDGLRSVVGLTSLRGRWEQLSSEPLTICDTGHNENGINEIVSQLNRTLGEREDARLICVLGFANDKDITSILQIFASLPESTHFIFTRASVARSLSTEVISEQATRLNMNYECVPTVPHRSTDLRG